MSFIQETYRCNNCKFEMNVALGTFGFGMPERCLNCGFLASQFEHLGAGWGAGKNENVEPPWHIGQHVEKVKGYDFAGVVVAVFTTRGGMTHIVVEMDSTKDATKGSGMLHIFSPEQVRLWRPPNKLTDDL